MHLCNPRRRGRQVLYVPESSVHERILGPKGRLLSMFYNLAADDDGFKVRWRVAQRLGVDPDRLLSQEPDLVVLLAVDLLRLMAEDAALVDAATSNMQYPRREP